MIPAVLLALGALPLACARSIPVPQERDVFTCTTQSIRKSWADLTSAEKQSYINADLCLMSLPAKAGIKGAKTRWDELQYAHAAQVRYIHNVGAFLPFHRYFVAVHDRLLRSECGYTGPLPYWDEPSDVGNVLASPLFKGTPSFGGNGAGSKNCIASGPFVNTTLHFNEDLTTSNYCISRSINNQGFSSAARSNVEVCLKKTNFVDAWNCLEGKPHGGGHAGVSGTMINVLLSPGDPVFFLHHGYLDRVWWEWQSLNLTKRLVEIGGSNTPRSTFPSFPSLVGSDTDENDDALPAWSTTAIPGPDKAFENYFNDGGNTTTLNHTLWSAGILPNATIGDVMNGETGLVCADYNF